MKKLALLFVLGFLLFASGVVSVSANGDIDGEPYTCGEEDEDCVCTADVSQPNEEWYDPELVPVEWDYNYCSILDQEVYFRTSTNKVGEECNGGYYSIEELDNSVDREYGWENADADVPYEDGVYCACIYGEQTGSLPGVLDCSLGFMFDDDEPKSFIDFGEGTIWLDDYPYIDTEIPVTVTCEDDGSGPDTIYYNIYTEDEEGGWELVPGHEFSYEGDEVTFYFHEPSRHMVEYWCVDEAGNVESPHNEQVVIVESEAPIFTNKVVGEPKVPGCDEQSEEDCDWYVTQDTEICLTAEDPEPHPVGGVEMYCEVSWWNPETEQRGSYEIGSEGHEWSDDGCFRYTEDSYHSLYCWTEDALGNTGYDEEECTNGALGESVLCEADIVDSEAPYTWFEITGPSYGEFPMWIDGVSRVELNARDSEPHPVGVDATYFRTELVEDDYCLGKLDWQTTSKDDESWMTYAEPFGMEESCHVVEYYSVDELGNEEKVKYFFVFVDKTAPTLTKVVGEPSSSCNFLQSCEPEWNWSENSDLDEEQIPTQIDWKVTLETPITLSCEDQSPHPSGIGDNEDSGIWYRVVLDGKYEEASWQFEQTDELILWFEEESEHLLEFYCVDNVGKTSEHDIELFKVEGEPFYIPLNDKWNLISVPVNLLSSDVEEVFSNTPNLEGVWAYENGEWKAYIPEVGGNLEDILPGHGYWVKTSDESSILIGGELFSEAETPSSFNLDEGWNLIGYYGVATPKSAYCSLFSLVDTSIGFPRWSALYGYDSGSQDFVPLGTEDDMNAGKGYWIEMDVEDSYSPSSSCWYD